MLEGTVLDHAVDLRNVRPGDRLDIPYELTVTETLQVSLLEKKKIVRPKRTTC